MRVFVILLGLLGVCCARRTDGAATEKGTSPRAFSALCDAVLVSTALQKQAEEWRKGGDAVLSTAKQLKRHVAREVAEMRRMTRRSQGILAATFDTVSVSEEDLCDEGGTGEDRRMAGASGENGLKEGKVTALCRLQRQVEALKENLNAAKNTPKRGTEGEADGKKELSASQTNTYGWITADSVANTLKAYSTANLCLTTFCIVLCKPGTNSHDRNKCTTDGTLTGVSQGSGILGNGVKALTELEAYKTVCTRNPESGVDLSHQVGDAE
ncbi:hypothetical protein TRVL_07396 [Trypanosoma vivax]|nr:hypothetical protein TRVL_07396 [Trypanosoma vivax]